MIDLLPYLMVCGKLGGDSAEQASQLGPELEELCVKVSRILRETGALLVKDPRCTVEDNDRFLDMMEKYFERPSEFKRLQERPNLHYQVLVCFLHILDFSKSSWVWGFFILEKIVGEMKEISLKFCKSSMSLLVSYLIVNLSIVQVLFCFFKKKIKN